MKKINTKGFTMFELVIVIAVIAILATVLVPTFSHVIEKSKNSAALQAGVSFYEEVVAEDISDGKLDGKSNSETDTEVINKEFWLKFTQKESLPAGITDFKYEADGNKIIEFKIVVNGRICEYDTKAEKFAVRPIALEDSVESDTFKTP